MTGTKTEFKQVLDDVEMLNDVVVISQKANEPTTINDFLSSKQIETIRRALIMADAVYSRRFEGHTAYSDHILSRLKSIGGRE